MMEKVDTEEEGKSYALRLLIHYLGDIAQPLHSTTRVNDEFPKGDLGGNRVPLPYHYTVDNLHALWDAAIYEFHESIHCVRIYNLNLLYSLCLKNHGKKLETYHKHLFLNIL